MQLKATLIALVAASSPLHAVQGQAIPPSDSAQLATIERLLVVADMERTYQESLDATLREQVRVNPSMAAYRDVIRAFMDRYASYAVVKPDMVQLYRDLFSEAEVQELIVFYQGDFGRRFTAKMATFATRSTQLTTTRIQAHLPELTAEIQSRIRD